MADDKADLESFLGKVDEIESIVKGLNSQDEGTTKDAMGHADDFLKKFGALPKQLQSQVAIHVDDKKKKYPPRDNTGVNRSVINQKAFDEPLKPTGPYESPEMDQESFLKVLEQDINERTARRKESEEKAVRLKDLGNDEFKAGNYEKAVEFYVEASTHFKDMTALWTNLAQAYIKLVDYEKALDACEWAFRTFENSLKACVHQGRAYLGLKEYDKAIDSYHRALQIDPKKEPLIKGYMQEVELARRTEEQEASAQALFNQGAPEAHGLLDLMQRVNKQGELPLYYGGGLRLIREALVNVDERTLFRTNGGLKWTRSHPFIAKCFYASPSSLSREELDMCASLLEMLQAACTNCEESQKQLFESSNLAGQILKFLESKVKFGRWVKGAAVNLLLQVSLSETGRSTIVTSFDIPKLLIVLFNVMKSKGVVGLNAASLLNNLALDNRFKTKLRGGLQSNVLPAFEALITGEADNKTILTSCISTMTNLCGDAEIRRILANREETWNGCRHCMGANIDKLDSGLSEEPLVTLLGFLMNLTFNITDCAKLHANEICMQCNKLLDCGKPTLELRSCGVLSHLLPHSPDVTNELCDKGVVPKLLELLKREDIELSKPAMKCLTACTQFNSDARTEITDYNKGLKTVVQGLASKDDVIIGNAALCLGHCAQIPRVCKALVKTDIIKELLVLARDGGKKTLQHNCAILIAKLAQGNENHLARLRELEGLGILHQVIEKVEKY